MTGLAKQAPPVLIVDLAKRYGGTEVRVLDMARMLHSRRYPYAVVTLVDSPLHRRLEAGGLVARPAPFSRADPRLLGFIGGLIRRGGYRVVDAHNVQSQFWGHLAAGRARRVSTVHSAYLFEHNHSLKGRAYEQVLRFNARWGVHFVAVSEANYTYLQQIGIPRQKVSLIYNSIQLPESTTRQRGIPLLQSLGWGPETYVVIVVARLEPVKGHVFLLEAVDQLRTELPQLRCLVVGEGRARPALEAQIERLNLADRVHLAGFRNDIDALLGASDLFCLPSLSEGLPYALLEACAHQLPLLVSRVGGMAELLAHRETAWLVPPAKPVALVEGLRWLVAHPEEAARLGRAGLALVRERFSPEEMITRTLAVYQQ